MNSLKCLVFALSGGFYSLS